MSYDSGVIIHTFKSLEACFQSNSAHVSVLNKDGSMGKVIESNETSTEFTTSNKCIDSRFLSNDINGATSMNSLTVSSDKSLKVLDVEGTASSQVIKSSLGNGTEMAKESSSVDLTSNTAIESTTSCQSNDVSRAASLNGLATSDQPIMEILDVKGATSSGISQTDSDTSNNTVVTGSRSVESTTSLNDDELFQTPPTSTSSSSIYLSLSPSFDQSEGSKQFDCSIERSADQVTNATKSSSNSEGFINESNKEENPQKAELGMKSLSNIEDFLQSSIEINDYVKQEIVNNSICYVMGLVQSSFHELEEFEQKAGLRSIHYIMDFIESSRGGNFKEKQLAIKSLANIINRVSLDLKIDGSKKQLDSAKSSSKIQDYLEPTSRYVKNEVHGSDDNVKYYMGSTDLIKVHEGLDNDARSMKRDSTNTGSVYSISKHSLECLTDTQQQNELDVAYLHAELSRRGGIITDLIQKEIVMKKEYEQEKYHLRKTMVTNERHLNEIILSIRHEKDVKVRELIESENNYKLLCDVFIEREQRYLREV